MLDPDEYPGRTGWRRLRTRIWRWCRRAALGLITAVLFCGGTIAACLAPDRSYAFWLFAGCLVTGGLAKLAGG